MFTKNLNIYLTLKTIYSDSKKNLFGFNKIKGQKQIL